MTGSFPVRDLLAESTGLQLTVFNPVSADLSRQITLVDLNRPGLALTGFFGHFAGDRIQIFGRGESAYLSAHAGEMQDDIFRKYFSYPMPCVVFTHDQQPPAALMQAAHEVPVLQTTLSTHRFIGLLTNLLDEKLAPGTSVHGVLVEVFGVGVLIQGKSGVGKSETALELIERGHRLVADDIVHIKLRNEVRLYGYASELFEHHMEIRGIGIIGIRDLFGSGSVRSSKRIDLIITLEDWVAGREYDRLGLENYTTKILGIDVAQLTLPVRPGRNLPILIEIAAKNHRLKQMGLHSARAFSERLRAVIEQKSTKNEDMTE